MNSPLDLATRPVELVVEVLRLHLTQLQSANVRSDSPAILDRNLRSVTRHRAPAVRHYVKEMSDRRLPQTILVITRRRRPVESATRDNPVAVTRHPMTDGAVNVVALLSAIQIRLRDGHRDRFDIVRKRIGAGAGRCLARSLTLLLPFKSPAVQFLSKKEFAILPQVTARHCAFNERPLPVVKRVRAIRFHARLILHVASAASEQ